MQLSSKYQHVPGLYLNTHPSRLISLAVLSFHVPPNMAEK